MNQRQLSCMLLQRSLYWGAEDDHRQAATSAQCCRPCGQWHTKVRSRSDVTTPRRASLAGCAREGHLQAGANISEKRSGTDDGGTEGPERGVEARSAGAPRGVGSREGRRSPSPVWGSGGYAPRKFFQKSTLKSRIFRHFCKRKWSLLQWSQGRIRTIESTKWSNKNATLCIIAITLPRRDHLRIFH